MSSPVSGVELEVALLQLELLRLGSPSDEALAVATFGQVVDDERCEQIFEAVVGTLRAAKRSKAIRYDSEMLLKGVSDDVKIYLLKPPREGVLPANVTSLSSKAEADGNLLSPPSTDAGAEPRRSRVAELRGTFSSKQAHEVDGGQKKKGDDVERVAALEKEATLSAFEWAQKVGLEGIEGLTLAEVATLGEAEFFALSGDQLIILLQCFEDRFSPHQRDAIIDAIDSIDDDGDGDDDEGHDAEEASRREAEERAERERLALEAAAEKKAAERERRRILEVERQREAERQKKLLQEEEEAKKKKQQEQDLERQREAQRRAERLEEDLERQKKRVEEDLERQKKRVEEDLERQRNDLKRVAASPSPSQASSSFSNSPRFHGSPRGSPRTRALLRLEADRLRSQQSPPFALRKDALARAKNKDDHTWPTTARAAGDSQQVSSSRSRGPSPRSDQRDVVSPKVEERQKARIAPHHDKKIPLTAATAPKKTHVVVDTQQQPIEQQQQQQREERRLMASTAIEREREAERQRERDHEDEQRTLSSKKAQQEALAQAEAKAAVAKAAAIVAEAEAKAAAIVAKAEVQRYTQRQQHKQQQRWHRPEATPEVVSKSLVAPQQLTVSMTTTEEKAGTLSSEAPLLFGTADKNVLSSSATSLPGEYSNSPKSFVADVDNLDSEVANKKREKAQRDAGEYLKALHWMAEVTKDRSLSVAEGEDAYGHFGALLLDGVKLCELLNAIAPKTVPPAKPSHLAFKQLSNITSFNRGCQKLGLEKRECFDAQDLQKQLDLRPCLQTLQALSRFAKAQVPTFKGPYLKAKSGDSS